MRAPNCTSNIPSDSSGWLFGGHYGTEWVSFLLFWGLNILIVYKGMELVRKVENLAAPYVLVMTALLVAWAVMRAKAVCVEQGGTSCSGLGDIMHSEGKFKTFGEFWPVFVPSVTAGLPAPGALVPWVAVVDVLVDVVLRDDPQP